MANTYYVDTASIGGTASDSNNGLSPTTPFLTIQAAVGIAHAGDTILLRAGTYSGANNTIDNTLYFIASGNTTAPITFAAYPGNLSLQPTSPGPRGQADVVMILPGANTAACNFLIPGVNVPFGGANTPPNCWVFEDIIFNGNNITYFMNPDTTSPTPEVIQWNGGAANNMLVHCEVKLCGTNGLTWGNHNATVHNSDNQQVLYCTLHDNGHSPTYTIGGYGAYTESNNNIFLGNDIYSNHSYGAQIRGNQNIVAGNKFHHNLVNVAANNTLGGESGGGCNFLADVSANGGVSHSNPGDTLETGFNNMFYNNSCYDNGRDISTGLPPNQIGGVATAGVGFLGYTYEYNLIVYNNTVYNNWGDGLAFQYYDATMPPIVDNNISYGNLTDYNDYGNVNGAQNVILGSNNMFSVNPLFVSPSGPTPNLQVMSGSGAIGTGTNLSNTFTTDILGQTRPASGPWTKGAYQFFTTITHFLTPSAAFTPHGLLTPKNIFKKISGLVTGHSKLVKNISRFFATTWIPNGVIFKELTKTSGSSILPFSNLTSKYTQKQLTGNKLIGSGVIKSTTKSSFASMISLIGNILTTPLTLPHGFRLFVYKNVTATPTITGNIVFPVGHLFFKNITASIILTGAISGVSGLNITLPAKIITLMLKYDGLVDI